jgi:hypothetical protein
MRKKRIVEKKGKVKGFGFFFGVLSVSLFSLSGRPGDDGRSKKPNLQAAEVEGYPLRGRCSAVCLWLSVRTQES